MESNQSTNTDIKLPKHEDILIEYVKVSLRFLKNVLFVRIICQFKIAKRYDKVGLIKIIIRFQLIIEYDFEKMF